MKFTEEKIAALKAMNTKVMEIFNSLSADEMDIKPSEKSWSMNECLDHLIRTNSSYFDCLDAISKGNYHASAWSKIPLLPGFFGKMILGVVSPDAKKNTRTFKIWNPSKSKYGTNLTSEMILSNNVLIEKIKALPESELDRIITSPAGNLVNYSLKMALEITTTHQIRHYNQAVRVKQESALKNLNPN